MFSLSNVNLRVALVAAVVSGVAFAPAAKADPSIPNNLTLDVTDTLSVFNPVTISGKLSNSGSYNLDFTFTASAGSYNIASTTGSKVTLLEKINGVYQAVSTVWGNGTNSESGYISAGSYEVAVTGIGTKNQLISTTIGLSPAPIPAALPLFGSALVGVGLLGRRRQKKRAAV